MPYTQSTRCSERKYTTLGADASLTDDTWLHCNLYPCNLYQSILINIIKNVLIRRHVPYGPSVSSSLPPFCKSKKRKGTRTIIYRVTEPSPLKNSCGWVWQVSTTKKELNDKNCNCFITISEIIISFRSRHKSRWISWSFFQKIICQRLIFLNKNLLIEDERESNRGEYNEGLRASTRTKVVCFTI